MDVIGHDDGREEITRLPVVMVTGTQNNVASLRREVLSLVSGKGDEVWASILLNVG